MLGEPGAKVVERRASVLEALSSSFFERERSNKKLRAEEQAREQAAAEKKKQKNPLDKAGKESFSPAATWMKPLVRGLNRFSRGNRNHEIVRGVGRHSRSQMYHKRGVWAVKAKNGGSLPSHPKRPAKQVAAKKDPKFYAADDVPKPLHKNSVVNFPKLRPNITPGTVLILLAGYFKGKRVVFLKQMDSGLLLVTGPFKVNGVPLKRVNQSYVISTSTKINIGHYDLEKFSDSYFKQEVMKKRKGESAFFQAEDEGEEQQPLSEERKSDQIAVDAYLIPIIDKVHDLKSYLSSRFSLKSGVNPHLLVF
ncbi:unnamed protein product [Calypogeia fissa]